MERRKFVIEGNRGVGKTTLCRKLKALCLDVREGRLSKRERSDLRDVQIKEDEYWFILDAPAMTCSVRLRKAKGNMKGSRLSLTELRKKRNFFFDVDKTLPDSVILNANCSEDEVLEQCLVLLDFHGWRPTLN